MDLRATLNRKNSGVDANETRTHNATNELTARTIAAESARYWVNDDFADNEIVQWSAADLDGDGTTSGGDDGSWSASGGKGQCDTLTTVTGAPGTGNDASVLLVDAGAMQDVLVSAGVTLNSGADGGGIVFGYVDNANYWVLLIDSGGTFRLYQVSSGTFTLRKSSTVTVFPPGSFGVYCEVRSGSIDNISGMTGGYTPASPIPAGKVGLWAGSGSATIQYDNFKALGMGMPKEIDGKWYAAAADTTITSGKLQFGTLDAERLAVRRGFRGGKYVFECDHRSNLPGVILQECLPGLRWSPRLSQSPQVRRNGRFGQPVAQKREFRLNARRAPSRILSRHAANQRTNLRRESRPAGPSPARLPTPM